MSSPDVTDIDKGCYITSALQEHALALQKITLEQGVVNPSDLRCLEPSTSPGEKSGTHPSSSSLKNSSRSACVSAPTFIKNPDHMNAAAPQHCEGVKEQHQSGNTRLDAQEALWMITHKKISKLLDREASKGSNNIPEVGTSVVLAIKQEPQKLITPVQVAIQNQQELSAAVQRSLEASVYGGMAVDES